MTSARSNQKTPGLFDNDSIKITQPVKGLPSEKMNQSVDESIFGPQITHHAIFPNHAIHGLTGSQYQDNTPSAQKRK
jgi:hypothetical protein